MDVTEGGGLQGGLDWALELAARVKARSPLNCLLWPNGNFGGLGGVAGFFEREP